MVDEKFHVSRKVLAGLFVLALALRAIWGAYSFVRSSNVDALDFPDEQQYWMIASSLRAGNGLTDELGFHAGRMPLYPAILAPFTTLSHGVAWAKVLQWFMGSLAAPLAAIVGARVFQRRVGLLAGAFVAIDPYLIVTASLLLTETMFTVALLGFLVLVARWSGPGRDPLSDQSNHARFNWLCVGLLGAACIYSKESSIALVALAIPIAAFVPEFKITRVGGAIEAFLVITAALAPWAIRNRQVLGETRWLTLRGGISLYDGVRPGATGASDLGDVKRMPAVRGLSELEWDTYFRRQAWQCIRDDPGRILRLAIVKLARTWNPSPNIDTHNLSTFSLAAGIWTIGLFVAAIAGLALNWSFLSKFAIAILVLPIIYFSAVHCLFVGSVRYRIPLHPLLAILAASGILAIIHGRNPQGARD
ncbi:MAG: hypothetical protein HY287_09180 [Planctomycetes bacterium]|nr:hypothetical protein [Planctomycetota bacterium]MBI3834483.1 hypothetical protein [Planctomycetota bacterium]